MNSNELAKKKIMNYAIWLSGENDSFSKLHQLIKSKNDRPFYPHLTILGQLKKSSIGLFEEISYEHILLEIEELNYSDDFFKSTYLSLRKNEKLIQLAKQLQLSFNTNFQLDPHISLSYGSKISVEQSIIPSNIIADKLFLVQAESWKEINSWVIIKKIHLKKK